MEGRIPESLLLSNSLAEEKEMFQMYTNSCCYSLNFITLNKRLGRRSWHTNLQLLKKKKWEKEFMSLSPSKGWLQIWRSTLLYRLLKVETEIIVYRRNLVHKCTIFSSQNTVCLLKSSFQVSQVIYYKTYLIENWMELTHVSESYLNWKVEMEFDHRVYSSRNGCGWWRISLL